MAINTALSFRINKIKEIDILVDTLQEYNSQLLDINNTVKQSINSIMSSDFIAHKVAYKIIEENLNQLDSLKIVHKSLYKINEQFTMMNINLLPEANTIYTDSKSLFDTTKLEIMNDLIFNKVTTSNAEREREVNFIMNKANQVMLKINNLFKQIKNYYAFMEHQLSYLNKLDSMIRLKNNIVNSGAIGEILASGNSVIQTELWNGY